MHSRKGLENVFHNFMSIHMNVQAHYHHVRTHEYQSVGYNIIIELDQNLTCCSFSFESLKSGLIVLGKAVTWRI